MSELSNKFHTASRWALITEIVAKLMPPITNMVLARLLDPAAFGMVATVTMVTSFAEVFADAGFQKYIVQRNFSSEKDLDLSTTVAFWTNLIISLVLWSLIIVFRHNLAAAVGNAGLGNAIAVASAALPLMSFSSIQMARYRRELDFKTLFYVRLVAICIPLFITIPLAFILHNFWALIIGTLTVHLSNAVLMTIRSHWKPKLYYSINRLKDMFAFSMWTLFEQLLGWANLNIGIFVVGRYLTDYYLGIYKTSMAYVNQVMGIIITAFSPVLLSTLSRIKDDEDEYKSFFYQFERNISIVILPLGIGIFVYRELFTRILLGSQWGEAVNFIGLWSLMRAIQATFGIFSMEVFVSKGKPQYSVIEQILVLACLLPTLLITAKMGYNTLYVARSLVVLWAIFIELSLLKIGAGISPIIIACNCLPYMLTAMLMGGAGICMLRVFNSMIIQIASIFVCIAIYFGVLFLFPRTRGEVKSLIKSFVK